MQFFVAYEYIRDGVQTGMIFYVKGDLLQSCADVLVNEVDCEGVMGKGLALQFKRKFPESYNDYRNACGLGLLRSGVLHWYRERGKLIVNFPTKIRWRDKSKVEYITTGLEQLSHTIAKHSIKSIAIPALGCGKGGLRLETVKPIIEKELNSVSQFANIYIYTPKSI